MPADPDRSFRSIPISVAWVREPLDDFLIEVFSPDVKHY